MWHWLDCNLFPLKNSASNTINKNIETIIQFFLEVRQVCSNIIIKNEKIINYAVFWKTYYEFQKSPLVPSPHHFQKVKDSGLAAFNLGWPRLSWGKNFLVSPFKWTKTPIKEQLLQKIINKKRAVGSDNETYIQLTRFWEVQHSSSPSQQKFANPNLASYLPPKKLTKFRPFLNPFLTISENVSHPTSPTRVDGVRTELNVALKLSIAANLNKHYISQFSYCYLRRCLSALTCIPFRNHFSFLRLHHLRATKKRLRLDIFCNFLF